MFNFDWLAGLPLPWGRFLVILALIIPMVFALTLPRKYIYQGAEDQSRWRNLKIWVFVIVAIQISIYLYFR